MVFQNGKRAAYFPFVELLNSYIYTREHSALFLQSLRIARSQESNLDSCRQRTKFAAFTPFSPERSFVLQAFLFLAFVFLSFIRKNSSSLLQSHWIAQPRESNLDSCRPMSPGSYRPANPSWIRTDSKRSLRPFCTRWFCNEVMDAVQDGRSSEKPLFVTGFRPDKEPPHFRFSAVLCTRWFCNEANDAVQDGRPSEKKDMIV